MLRALVCAVLALRLGVAHAAEPPTLAVLPLEKGAGSAQYDGLGRALAGMLVSDLSTLPGLRLVERDQLDALLAEMKLKDTGFLDPKTAQKLGKGVGARFVVAGSFTVVEPRFVLDARVVEVQSGEIVKAAAADGTVEDFVAVEKELVEELVAGLDLTLTSSERRKLLTQAPTEKFAAFTAWSQGMARKEEGKVEEAKAAFERALAVDPAFADAQAALGELAAAVKVIQAERESKATVVRDARHAAVLAEIPDERTRPKGFTYDVETLADWAIRLGVLEAEGRECERYAEMRHYLDRVGWKVTEPPGRPKDGGVFGFVVYERAKGRGLDGANVEPGTPEHLRAGIPTRVAGLFRDTPSFVMAEHTQYKRGHGLVSSLLACHAPKAALAEIDGLLAAVRKAGVAGVGVDIRMPLTLEERLELLWARTRAEHLGADAELARRTQALLDRRKADDTVQATLLAEVDAVLALGRAWETHRIRRRALPDEEIARRMRLLQAGTVVATPVCTPLHRVVSQGAIYWVAEYDRQVKERGAASADHLDSPFAQWSSAADLGCFEGLAPRFPSPEAAWTWIDAARERQTPDVADERQCPGAWGNFDQLVSASKATRTDAVHGPLWLGNVWITMQVLVFHRCIRD